MRHFLQGAPLPVLRLPSRMGAPASPGLLIHTARPPLSLPLGQRRTIRRTVSAPAITRPTQEKLTPASGAATVDEIHAAASSPPGWTSSGPRAIQDPLWWVPLCTGSPSRARSANSGPSAYLGAVTFSPLRHHAWQHQPAPRDPPRSIRSPRRASRRSVPVGGNVWVLVGARAGQLGYYRARVPRCIGCGTGAGPNLKICTRLAGGKIDLQLIPGERRMVLVDVVTGEARDQSWCRKGSPLSSFIPTRICLDCHLDCHHPVCLHAADSTEQHHGYCFDLTALHAAEYGATL